MSEAHHCRLFVRLPAGSGFEEALTGALKDPEAASVLLPEALPIEAARAAIKRIQAADRPALVIDDIERRGALQADGVHAASRSRAAWTAEHRSASLHPICGQAPRVRN